MDQKESSRGTVDFPLRREQSPSLERSMTYHFFEVVKRRSGSKSSVEARPGSRATVEKEGARDRAKQVLLGDLYRKAVN